MPAGGAALFGGTATGPGSTGGNKHLIEIKAGKMNLKGRMVYPDKRKGMLYVYQSEDSLMHFCWQDRATGVVEDDLIIFPDDCEYVKVPQCTTGRVYVLKFKSSSRRFFFWYQDPNGDRDEDNCRQINEVLNNPQSITPASQPQESELQSLLNNMSQSQLMQLFGGAQMGGLSSLLGSIRGPNSGSARTSSTTPAITHRPAASAASSAAGAGSAGGAAPASGTVTPPKSTPPPVTPDAPPPSRGQGRNSGLLAQAPAAGQGTLAAAAAAFGGSRGSAGSGGGSSANPIQLSDIQNFLQAFTPTGGSGTTTATTDGGSGGQQQQQQQQQSVDLSTALTSDALSGVLVNAEALQHLQDHLPPVDGDTQEALRSTLASPQFQQAVSQFSSALESGQLAPVVSQLAVNPEAVAAAAQGNMQEFVKALEKNSASPASGKESAEAKEKDKKDDKDDDEQMQLD